MIQMHYDGWLALPAAVRQKLGVTTGDQLKVEFTGGTVVLRPARRTNAVAADRAASEPEIATEPPVEVTSEPTPTVTPSPAVKRGPGRPRKVPTSAALPQSLKTRGRRKSVPTAEAQTR